MVITKDMKVITINTAMEHLCGISATHYLNKSFLYFSENNSHLTEIIQKILQTGQTIFEFEYSFLDKRGGSFPVDIAASPLSEPNDSIAGAVLELRDLRRIEELKENMRFHKWFSNIEAMASGMAHEIKNPLGGIRGAAQLLQMELKKEGFKKYLKVIIKEVDRINNIVENFFRFNKPKKINFRSVNIHKIIEEILLLQKESPLMKNIQIKLNYDPSLPLVEADEGKLKQVFLNLIQNSMEAMKRNGTLTVSTKLYADFQILSKKQRAAIRMILVEIKDTGEGLSDDIINKLFTPFFTTKSNGSGLGLFISQKIIDEHRGRLKLKKNKDKGTTAQVYIPLRRE